MNRLAGAVVISLIAAMGCGDDRNPILGSTDGGPDNRPDADPNMPDAALIVPDATVNLEGPEITILAPTEPAAGDYSSAAIIVDNSIQVTCKVLKNATTGDLINPNSVLITAVGGGRTATAKGVPSGAANEYTATIDIDDFPNGVLSVRCEASDEANPPRTNSAQMETFLDLGPRIDVFSPQADTSYANSVDISIAVTPQPVAANDTLAGIATVKAYVGAVEIPLVDNGAGIYLGTIDFDAPEFVPPLDEAISVDLRATNLRTATAVTRKELVGFIADSQGPQITITSPAAGTLVSGILTVTAVVDDLAGVASVVGTFAHQYEFTMFPTGGGAYVGAVDTRVAGRNEIFPLVEVRARDEVDNEAVASTVYMLDNTRPKLDMDSPPVYEYRCVNNGNAPCPAECGAEFDPLGDYAVDDQQSVGQLSFFRARAEDFGNVPLTSTTAVLPKAGIKLDSIEILILDDTSVPLLVDTDSDGICDDFNPDIVPTTNPPNPGDPLQAAKMNFSPIPSQGVSLMSIGTGSSEAMCYQPIAEVQPPVNICPSVAATRIVGGGTVTGPDGYRQDVPAPIFGQAPFQANANCLGQPFDALLNNMSDGWACVAARGVDNLGNTNVSPPLRVCFDKDGDGLDDTGASLAAQGCKAYDDPDPIGTSPDTCLASCTIPAGFSGIDGFSLGIATRQCANGVDDDQDGFKDYPLDPQCDAPNDNAEAN